MTVDLSQVAKQNTVNTEYEAEQKRQQDIGLRDRALVYAMDIMRQRTGAPSDPLDYLFVDAELVRAYLEAGTVPS